MFRPNAPSIGTQTLFDFYAILVSGAAVSERGDHAVFCVFWQGRTARHPGPVGVYGRVLPVEACAV
jgi:hypothetical protein